VWLTDAISHLDLFDNDWPIWTYGEIAPPGKFVHAVDGRRRALSSLVADGCIVSGASISRSLLFTDAWSTRIRRFASPSSCTEASQIG
jgi:glucose-1-phosphate adenylyltransferase